MFGYLRPEKNTLLVKEFTIYRAVYCGICKQIKKDYGNIPRASLSYDITFLGVLLIALSGCDADFASESCILGPLKKKPVCKDHPVITACAAVSVIFAYYKLVDEIRDDKRFLASAGRLLIKRGYKRASSLFPEAERVVGEGISLLSIIEQNDPDETSCTAASQAFGTIIQRIMEQISISVLPEDIKHRQETVAALGILGSYIGRWIYLIDAVDDLAQDVKKGQWNPLSVFSTEDAYATAGRTLSELSDKCDETAALLPYNRNAGIISNVFREGMKAMEQMILSGIKPGKL